MSKNQMTEVAMHAVKGGMPVKEAAEAAGVHRTTLWRALKKAKTATEQLERVRGDRKREALEMLLSKQMELIYNALDRLPPEELDKQGAPFLKDLARTGTVNMGIILDKIAKSEEAGEGGILVTVNIPEVPKKKIKTLDAPAEVQPSEDASYLEVEIDE